MCPTSVQSLTLLSQAIGPFIRALHSESSDSSSVALLLANPFPLLGVLIPSRYLFEAVEVLIF